MLNVKLIFSFNIRRPYFRLLDRLVYLRTVLERIQPMDRKLKYQIDKLVKLAATGSVRDETDLMYKPDPSNLVPKVCALRWRRVILVSRGDNLPLFELSNCSCSLIAFVRLELRRQRKARKQPMASTNRPRLRPPTLKRRSPEQPAANDASSG